MTERILVPIDGSDQAWEALDYVVRERPDADLVVLNVINPMEGAYGSEGMTSDYWEGWYENAEGRAERLFEEARERASDYDGTIETAVETGNPARAIVEYAEESGVDHVVMGSHGRSGVSRILLGSVAESVVRRATVPVTIVR